MTFHEARVDLICHILNKDDHYYKLIKIGNAYGKLLRNYHQINAEGKMVYRNKRALNHLVFSKDAKDWYDMHGKMTKKPFHQFHYEHSVPIKVIIEKLEELRKNHPITNDQVKRTLDLTSLVVITKEERDRIDDKKTGFKDRMPNGWQETPEEIHDRFNKIPVPIKLTSLDNKL